CARDNYNYDWNFDVW
nr:immunoglobulin heavy chain junction region [Mus musculus]